MNFIFSSMFIIQKNVIYAMSSETSQKKLLNDFSQIKINYEKLQNTMIENKAYYQRKIIGSVILFTLAFILAIIIMIIRSNASTTMNICCYLVIIICMSHIVYSTNTNMNNNSTEEQFNIINEIQDIENAMKSNITIDTIINTNIFNDTKSMMEINMINNNNGYLSLEDFIKRASFLFKTNNDLNFVNGASIMTYWESYIKPILTKINSSNTLKLLLSKEPNIQKIHNAVNTLLTIEEETSIQDIAKLLQNAELLNENISYVDNLSITDMQTYIEKFITNIEQLSNMQFDDISALIDEVEIFTYRLNTMKYGNKSLAEIIQYESDMFFTQTTLDDIKTTLLSTFSNNQNDVNSFISYINSNISLISSLFNKIIKTVKHKTNKETLNTKSTTPNISTVEHTQEISDNEFMHLRYTNNSRTIPYTSASYVPTSNNNFNNKLTYNPLLFVLNDQTYTAYQNALDAYNTDKKIYYSLNVLEDNNAYNTNKNGILGVIFSYLTPVINANNSVTNDAVFNAINITYNSSTYIDTSKEKAFNNIFYSMMNEINNICLSQFSVTDSHLNADGIQDIFDIVMNYIKNIFNTSQSRNVQSILKLFSNISSMISKYGIDNTLISNYLNSSYKFMTATASNIFTILANTLSDILASNNTNTLLKGVVSFIKDLILLLSNELEIATTPTKPFELTSLSYKEVIYTYSKDNTVNFTYLFNHDNKLCDIMTGDIDNKIIALLKQNAKIQLDTNIDKNIVELCQYIEYQNSIGTDPTIKDQFITWLKDKKTSDNIVKQYKIATNTNLYTNTNITLGNSDNSQLRQLILSILNA